MAIVNVSQSLENLRAPFSLQEKKETQASCQVALDVLKDTAVTIYQNTSQFSDYFSATISSSQTDLVYNPLLPNSSIGTPFVHLDQAQGEISNQVSCDRQFNLSSYINSLIGKDVKLHLDDGEVVEGRLLGRDGEKFTLYIHNNVQHNEAFYLPMNFQKKHDGFYASSEGISSSIAFVLSEDVAFIQSKDLDQAIAVKPYIKAKYITDKSPEDIKGQVVFFNQAMRWSAQYRLLIEETQDDLKGRWVANARISNTSNIELKDLMVKVVGGDLNELGGGGAPMPCYNEMRARCASSTPKAAIEQNWQDLKAYVIPHRVSLKPSEVLDTPLYDPQNISLTKRYVLHSYEHQNGQRHPSVCYNIENDSENHLGHAFPKGEVQVYRKEGSSLDFIGKHSINQTPKGEDLEITTGESFDLMSKRSMETEVIRNGKGKVIAHEITVKIELSNGSNEDHTLHLHEHVQGQKKLLETSLPVIREDSKELVFKVDIPKETTSKKPMEFTYKYRREIA